MHYVYILRSLSDPIKAYIGKTDDLKTRIAEHNNGNVAYTSKCIPWELETYVAFKDKAKASKFESYLKHGSGHAFAKRHF